MHLDQPVLGDPVEPLGQDEGVAVLPRMRVDQGLPNLHNLSFDDQIVDQGPELVGPHPPAEPLPQRRLRRGVGGQQGPGARPVHGAEVGQHPLLDHLAAAKLKSLDAVS